MNPVLFRWVQGKVQPSSERCVRTGDTFSRADRLKMRPRVSRASGSIIHYLNARLRTCKDFAGLFHWLRHLLTPAPMLFCLGAHMRYAGAGPTSRPSCKRVAAFVRASSSNGPIRSWWPPLRALFSILLSVCLSLMWISENQSDLVPLAFRGHPALAAPPRRLTSPQWPPLGLNPLCARTTSWWGGVRVCVCASRGGNQVFGPPRQQTSSLHSFSMWEDPCPFALNERIPFFSHLNHSKTQSGRSTVTRYVQSLCPPPIGTMGSFSPASLSFLSLWLFFPFFLKSTEWRSFAVQVSDFH